jgi:RNA polymerase sigma-70 factor (ECF subfamily)
VDPDPLDTTITDLFEEHYSALVATAYALVRDRGIAEEIAQEAFARLIDRWDRLQHYDAPGAWLQLVTVRLASRRRVRRWREDVLVLRPERAAPSISTGIGNDISAAMATLSRLDRKVVAMRYFADLSIGQIASELGMAQSTVRVHLHRGRNGIRAHLSGGQKAVRDGSARQHLP